MESAFQDQLFSFIFERNFFHAHQSSGTYEIAATLLALNVDFSETCASGSALVSLPSSLTASRDHTVLKSRDTPQVSICVAGFRRCNSKLIHFFYLR